MLLAVLGAALIVTAARLEPDHRGHGTHEQLGLNPCWVVTRFGVPCPGCGMTTSWALAAGGNLRAALGSNAAGVLLFGVVLVATPAALAAAASGAAPRLRFGFDELVLAGSLFVGLLMLDWLRRVLLS